MGTLEVSSRKVVLIVEDDAAIRAVLKKMLHRLGLKVVEASNIAVFKVGVE